MFSQILSFLFVLIFFLSNAQEKTNMFIYDFRYKNDSTSIKLSNEKMVLEISNQDVKFYDYSFLKYDSINKKTGSNWQTNSQTQQMLIRTINSSKNTSYKDIGFDYFLIKSDDVLEWIITDDLKYEGNYKLQKATCTFGKRNWIAWFCNELPFYEGPYKFNGLPGLIFQIHDDKLNFIYSLAKIYTLPYKNETEIFLQTHYGIKPIEIDLIKYNELLLTKYSDPVRVMKDILKNGGVVNINNEIIKTPSQLDVKRKEMMAKIKKYYNPLELDKAVNYE